MANGTKASFLLPLEDLEADLRSAEEELAIAQEERLRANEVEEGWLTEVKSLKSLIEVRRRRLHPSLVNPQAQSPPAPPLPKEEPASSAPKLTHTDWMVKVITESGNVGMTASEILTKSISEGRKMHENYPYTATKELVEQGRIVKRESRYFAP